MTDICATSDYSINVQGMKETKCILMAYQKKSGAENPDLIITSKKGKTVDKTSLKYARMRPSLNKWYQVSNLHLHSIIITVIKEFRVYFSIEDLSSFWLMSKDFANMIPKALCWLRVDFTPMCKPRQGY